MRVVEQALAVLSLVAVSCGSPPPPRVAPVAKAAVPASLLVVDPNAFRDTPPPTGSPAPVKFPTPTVTVLKNGLSLYVVPKHSAVATLTVVVRHGASSIPLGKSGLAAITARMLTEGTTKLSSLALAEASEALGSTLQADAGRDESHVSIATLTSDVPRGLELLSEVVFTPAFREQDFKRVKGEWLDGLRAERQEPPRLASLVALRSLLGPTAGAPVSGSLPDVERLTVADLVRFHARAYVPSNLAVIAVGDLTPAALAPDVERLFGAAVGAPFPVSTVAVNPKPPSQLRILIVDRKGAVQTSIFAVQSFPKRSEPGFEAREIMSSLLGGLFTSRLNLDLREKHAFTYGVHGQAIATRLWGAFFVATDVKTEATADSLVEILSELRQARDPNLGAPIQAQEAARARTDLIHSLGARLEQTSRIADSARSLFAQQLPADYYTKYPKLVASVPLAEVSREAARLDPMHLVVVLVGDRGKLEPELKQHGFQFENADPKLLE